MRTLIMAILLLGATTVAADELTPQQRNDIQQREAYRLWLLQTGSTEPYDFITAVQDACDNGNFERPLGAEWSGAYGRVLSNGDPDFANFTAGIVSGPLNVSSSRQTRVPNTANPGPDPVTGISQVAPGTGSSNAVRIGNSVNGAGSELLAKTFVVSASRPVLGFSYALVFEDPQHLPYEQPSFWVRVLDASGNPISGVADLGNGSDKAVADRTNPYFKTLNNGTIVYRDWSCASIDLRNYVGQTVTVQFIVEDCTQTGHYGYAYLDELCGACSPNNPQISYDPNGSTSCGSGKICFNYVLPAAGGNTGSVQIRLEIRQNNAVVATLTSPVLTTGTNYCFTVDPATIAGLSASAGSFQFSGIGDLRIGSTVLAPSVTAPQTYQIACTPVGCCPGTNLVTGGDFESGTAAFTSDYSVVASGPIAPGQYALYNSAQAAAASSQWTVQNQGTCSTSGRVLVVNGATGRTGPKRVWSQTVAVTPGAEYRFCAHFRNLPTCALDVRPRVELRFSSPASSSGAVTIGANAANACDWVQESRSIVIPAGVTSLTSEIWLDETGLGDGNDLAVDNISLQQMQPAAPGALLVNIASSNMTTTSFNITATPVNPQIHSFSWDVCEVDVTTGACIAGTLVSNPAAWTTPGAMTFPGYVGTSTLSGASAGSFSVQKRYRITYSVFGLCTSRSFSTWYFGFSLNAMRVVVTESLQDLTED